MAEVALVALDFVVFAGLLAEHLPLLLSNLVGIGTLFASAFLSSMEANANIRSHCR